MTLKQKFKLIFYPPTITDKDLKLLEDVADDYVIEFAEWYFYYTPENIVTSKELLEIFKKEKGL